MWFIFVCNLQILTHISSLSCLFPPQQRQQPVTSPLSQSAQPSPLPKPVPTAHHVPCIPHTPHVAALATCPGRGKIAKFISPEEMTSRDYYFDSYAHFGIHEVGRVKERRHALPDALELAEEFLNPVSQQDMLKSDLTPTDWYWRIGFSFWHRWYFIHDKDCCMQTLH